MSDSVDINSLFVMSIHWCIVASCMVTMMLLDSEGALITKGRVMRNADKVEDLVDSLLKKVEAILFYTPNPSGELEEFYVSSIQVAAKYHLVFNVRLNIILMEIRETAEMAEIINQHPGGNDEDFAAGIIQWAENYKEKFEDLGISASNALGKVNALAFDSNFRDSNTEERKDLIREILNSDDVKGPDNLKLGDEK